MRERCLFEFNKKQIYNQIHWTMVNILPFILIINKAINYIVQCGYYFIKTIISISKFENIWNNIQITLWSSTLNDKHIEIQSMKSHKCLFKFYTTRTLFKWFFFVLLVLFEIDCFRNAVRLLSYSHANDAIYIHIDIDTILVYSVQICSKYTLTEAKQIRKKQQQQNAFSIAIKNCIQTKKNQ